LSPQDFLPSGWALSALVNSLLVSIGRRNPRVAAHEGSGF